MAYDPERNLRYCIEQRAKEREQEEKQKAEEYKKYLENGGQPQRSWEEHMYVDADKPGTMDNATATIWYIIIMVVGAVFNDRLLIWIMASVIYFPFINRRKIRKKKWDKMQEEKKNGGNKK